MPNPGAKTKSRTAKATDGQAKGAAKTSLASPDHGSPETHGASVGQAILGAISSSPAPASILAPETMHGTGRATAGGKPKQAAPVHASSDTHQTSDGQTTEEAQPGAASSAPIVAPQRSTTKTDTPVHSAPEAPAYTDGQPVPGVGETQAPFDGLLLTIKTLGNLLDDLERVRIMNQNRIGAIERDMGSSLPDLDIVHDHLKAAEHEAELNIKRAWRQHPLAPWAKAYPGIGEKLIARLIAEIGDPGDRPNVAKLWAYCGLGDPARKRRKNMTQEEAFKLGNPHAKKICWLIGEAFVKVNRGPGREAYDAKREQYADRVHATACVRCGPAGHPAAPGSPWSLKHQHEAAKRYAVKMFLKDLWVASCQSRLEDHMTAAGRDDFSRPSRSGAPGGIAGEGS